MLLIFASICNAYNTKLLDHSYRPAQNQCYFMHIVQRPSKNTSNLIKFLIRSIVRRRAQTIGIAPKQTESTQVHGILYFSIYFMLKTLKKPLFASSKGAHQKQSIDYIWIAFCVTPHHKSTNYYFIVVVAASASSTEFAAHLPKGDYELEELVSTA